MHNYFKNKSGRQCFEFYRAFCVFGFSDLSRKEIDTNTAADSALFWRLAEMENRFCDVVKKFR